MNLSSGNESSTPHLDRLLFPTISSKKEVYPFPTKRQVNGRTSTFILLIKSRRNFLLFHYFFASTRKSSRKQGKKIESVKAEDFPLFHFENSRLLKISPVYICQNFFKNFAPSETPENSLYQCLKCQFSADFKGKPVVFML